MNHTIALISCFALTLAACSPEEDAAPKTDAVAPENPSEAGPEIANTADAEEQMPEAATPSTSGPAIPANMLGIWDAVTGTCAPDSDLRLEIGPRSIQFYESMGVITKIALAENGRIVELDMEGEGESWTQKMLLQIDETGDRLLLLDPDEPASPNDIARKRCPQ